MCPIPTPATILTHSPLSPPPLHTEMKQFLDKMFLYINTLLVPPLPTEMKQFLDKMYIQKLVECAPYPLLLLY